MADFKIKTMYRLRGKFRVVRKAPLCKGELSLCLI